ncbi:MAG: TonB-dependent receptor domain-containing protein [Alphaproteobacteria bacterium]
MLTDFQFWGGNTSLTAGLYLYADEIFQDASDSTTLEGPRSLDTTEAKNKAAAIFSQATWTPPIMEERVHLTLGLRGSFDDRQASRVNENSYAFAEKGGFTPTNCTQFSFFSTFISTLTPCVPNGTVEASDYEKSFWNFNPAGTIEFDASDDVNVYAKVVTGFKTGGTATRSANPENFAQGFDEEGIISYELGLKGQFFDGRLQTNGAAFYMQIDGFQTSIQTGPTPGDRDFVGINDSKIFGMELDITIAAYHGLFARISYGYLQTQLGQNEVTILNSAGEEKTYPLLSDFSYAPNHSFSISLDYMATLTSQIDMTAYLGYNFQSDMITSPNLEDTGRLEARGLIDANITFFTQAFGNGTTSLAFFGKNLLDKEYLIVNTSAFRFAGLDEQGSFGEPRTFGMSLKFEF